VFVTVVLLLDNATIAGIAPYDVPAFV